MDADTVSHATEVLTFVAYWKLAPERWDLVDDILRRIESRLAEGDPPGFRTAVAELERSGPVRLSRIGTAEVKGVPRPILIRSTALVHQLGYSPTKVDKDGHDARSSASRT